LTMQSLEQQVIQSSQNLDRLKAQSTILTKASNLEAQMSVSQIINHPLIQRLKEQILSLENKKTGLLENYLDQHPKVKTITLQIDRLTQAMYNEIKGIKRSFKNNLKTAQASHKILQQNLESIKRQARILQSQELSYQALETRVKSNQALYAQMEVRLKEAELQAQATANNVRILDLALVPTRHISPRLSLNLAAAFIGWLLLSLIFMLILDYLDRTLKTQSQLYELYQLSVLGSIPMINYGKRSFKQNALVRNSELYVLENPSSTVSECMRTIRTNLLFMHPNKSLRSLLVTSAAPREGKTLICINLGIAMALAGERILIIDSDLRRPRVHKVFGLTNDRGFINMLVDPEVEPEEVIRPTELDSLDLLCSGPLLPNPSELLQSSAFKRTLNRLLQDYDRVIFDSPPVVPVTDAQIIGRQIDGTVLVARAQQTHRDVFGRAVELLNNVQVTMLGGLLNGIDISREVYGHYYYQYKQEQGEILPTEKRFGR
jgi:polysaccharide biosynthesis transport protein